MLGYHYITSHQYVLYEGDLNATNDVITNKRLLLDKKYAFQPMPYNKSSPLTDGKFSFKNMSMYFEDYQVLFFEGQAV